VGGRERRLGSGGGLKFLFYRITGRWSPKSFFSWGAVGKEKKMNFGGGGRTVIS